MPSPKFYYLDYAAGTQVVSAFTYTKTCSGFTITYTAEDSSAVALPSTISVSQIFAFTQVTRTFSV